MKTYRPIKLWLILLTVVTIGILFGLLLLKEWKQVLVLVCTAFAFLAFILCTTYYIQFQDDKIVIKHGVSSFKKSNRSNFKARVILISDINDLLINYSNKYVTIGLKGGNNIMVAFGGYFNASDILDEFRNVKDKLR